ncbi:MAG: ACT domain-containing protein [Saccharofermentans sp.]|nr:ACT domain-containing protein [Saccharofermentans sp.]
MTIRVLEGDLSVCKVRRIDESYLEDPFCFIGKTDCELSLVCLTGHAPSSFIAREDGWRAMRIEGELDFSLIGILSSISKILADNKIGIFAVSTYNTDYILVKKEDLARAVSSLEDAGYKIVRG